jgi:hypothetical protein
MLYTIRYRVPKQSKIGFDKTYIFFKKPISAGIWQAVSGNITNHNYFLGAGACDVTECYGTDLRFYPDVQYRNIFNNFINFIYIKRRIRYKKKTQRQHWLSFEKNELRKKSCYAMHYNSNIAFSNIELFFPNFPPKTSLVKYKKKSTKFKKEIIVRINLLKNNNACIV